MSLDAVLEDVFQRGSGVSRAYALRTPRYRELSQSVPHITRTTKQETAELVLLGERLADRAFKNMPIFYRETALEWANNPHGRHPMHDDIILEMLMEEFTSTKWNKRRGLEPDRDRLSTEVLPATMKSWQKGKEQPNCLGLTQMLIGFARASGMRHLMVNVVHSHHVTMLARVYTSLDWLQRELKPFTNNGIIAREMKIAATWQSSCLEMLAEDHDTRAHHAVALEMPSGWIVLDPYLNRQYPLRLPPKRMDFILGYTQKLRSHLALSNNEAVQRIAYLQSAVRRVKKAIRKYERSDRPLDVETLKNEVLKDLFFAAVVKDEDYEAECAKIDSSLKTSLVSSRHFLRRFTQMGEEEQNAYYLQMRQKVQSSRYHQRFALYRLLSCVTREFMLGLGAIEENRTIEHPLIEMHHPAYNLAVMTLNHHAGNVHEPAGDLIRFSNSQVLIRDTLAEVQGGESRLLKNVLQVRLRHLKKFSGSMVMPELQAHIP